MRVLQKLAARLGCSSSDNLPTPSITAEVAPTNTVLQDQLPKGSETVLVAEDEGNIREFIASVLISLGYHVVEASDGEVAFSLFKGTLSGKVDLVLTDIIMPKINGKELACLVEKDEPLTKVLFCSGYPEKLAARNGMIDPKFPFIQKPFSPEILASKVRDVLDAPYPAEPLFQEDHA